MNSILRKEPGKRHPVLDYEKCKRLYTVKGDISHCINGPSDVHFLETYRKRLEFEKHPSLPTDIFVWAKGEPEEPYLTKFGGLPYLPKKIPWPLDAEGQPCIFLAQFCFIDSKDIVPVPVPGGVLLIFIKHDGIDNEYLACYEPEDIHFQWIQIGDLPIWDQQSIKANGFRSIDPTFFGVIHRTCDYEWSDEIEQKLDEAQKKQSLYLWDTPFAHGTKIGGLPHFHQNGPPDNYGNIYHVKGRTWGDATYIAQLTSLQFSSETPFPWCNREKPISLDSVHRRERTFMIGDAGSIYLYLKPDGTICWFDESG